MEARRIHTQQKLASQNRLAWVKGAANQQWDEPAFHCYLLRQPFHARRADQKDLTTTVVFN